MENAVCRIHLYFVYKCYANYLKVKHETFSLLHKSVNENENKSSATLDFRSVFGKMNCKSIKEHSKYVTNTDFGCKTF